MNNLYRTKQVLVVALAMIVIGTVFMTIKNRDQEPIVTEDKETETTIPAANKDPISMCYYRADKTDRGFYDKAWVKLNILDEKITGEFQHLPAESDSKIGTFEGTVGPVDQMSMSRTANVWWNSEAEGMSVKEELIIKFGEGSATVGFGEMIDKGDGVYVYKDKENLTYIKQMNQTDCEYLDEKIFVEKYIRENIEKIATNKAVLGGTWYVISTIVNPGTKTGEVTYEDGHIQSKALFTYSYDKNSNAVTFTKFDIKK